MPKPIIAVIVFIFNEDFSKILMIERVKNTFGYDWGYIGGKAEENESFFDAACREIKEEIGVTLQKSDLIPYDVPKDPIASHKKIAYYSFFAQIPENTKLHCRTEEVKQAKWFDIHQLPPSRPQDNVIKIAEQAVKLLMG